MSLLLSYHQTRLSWRSVARLFTPFKGSLEQIPVLESRGNRPLQMTFEDQLKILTYYHLEEHSSGRHLLQVLAQEDFAATHIAPPDGIKKSAFFEAINTRGLEQMVHVYEDLQKQVTQKIPVAKDISELGDLIAVDGSLIDATLSMTWADYRDGAKKAKVHLEFDIGRGVPQKVTLTDGKADERPQPLWPADTDPCGADHLPAVGDLLPRRAWRTCQHQQGARAAKQYSQRGRRRCGGWFRPARYYRSGLWGLCNFLTGHY